jgi:hypothetical protein
MVWQYLPWGDMILPLLGLAGLFLLAVTIKVFIMFQDPIYRDRILFPKDKGKK